MFGKLSKALVFVLVLSLALTGVAAAEEQDPPQSTIIAGEVTAVDVAASTFTLRNAAGEEVIVHVNDDTVFRSRDDSLTSLDDMEVGMFALARTEAQADGSLLALVVGATKAEDSPEVTRVFGEVTAVDAEAGIVGVQTNEGEAVDLHANDDTRFRSRDGSLESLEDVEVGMTIFARATADEDGALTALMIAAGYTGERPETIRILGEVTAVDAEAGIVGVQTNEGEAVDLHVNDDTRFRSRDGSLESLEDLEVGMTMFARATADEDGALTALMIAAGYVDQPSEGVRVVGEITAVDAEAGTIDVLTADGEEVSLQVDADTVFRSRNGTVDGIDDLEPEMIILSQAIEQEDGSLLAQVVVSGAGKTDKQTSFSKVAA